MFKPQASTTIMAIHPYTEFQMYNHHFAGSKVDFVGSQSQFLADAATKSVEQTDEQLVPGTGCRIFYLLNIAGFEIFLHYRKLPFSPCWFNISLTRLLELELLRWVDGAGLTVWAISRNTALNRSSAGGTTLTADGFERRLLLRASACGLCSFISLS
jgi:hypothetical protein